MFSRWFFSFVGIGNHVQGEVYEIDEKVLVNLDILEDHPKFYIRELFEVQALNETSEKVKAWIYIIKNFRQDLLNQTFYESYSSLGSHGKKYVERYLRTDDSKSEIYFNIKKIK